MIDEIPNPEGRLEDTPKDTPYTTYGDFNEDEAESDSTLFFQYGRFFGVSLGLGLGGATGNRGKLFRGGFPSLDVRIHYWFDFNLALNLQLNNTPFVYDRSTGTSTETHDVGVFYLGLDIKYYFNTRDLSAPLSFANPYVLIGGGQFTKSDSVLGEATPDQDSKFGFNLGGGFEFLINPKTTYFFTEVKFQLVNYDDRFTTTFASQGIDDLGGMFYSFTAGFLFTW